MKNQESSIVGDLAATDSPVSEAMEEQGVVITNMPLLDQLTCKPDAKLNLSIT